ncbi:MAG TPA: histidine kinase [Bryobacteraceae bacterium]|nr:histidine kinase [Bryobacteraceae bacterium]
MTEAQGALKRLLLSTIHARDAENQRVSRRLHDEVGQVLSAVGLQLDVLKLDFRGQLPELSARVDEVQRALDRAVQEVRALSYDLNPAVVERAGLHFALDRLVGRWRTGFDGTIRLLSDASLRVPLPVANAWYKIAEHAIENSVMHAECTKIEVHVRAGAKSAALEVRDNGKGFPVDETRSQIPGLGLLLIEHYASMAGLHLSIRSSAGKGTAVSAKYNSAPQGESRARSK